MSTQTVQTAGVAAMPRVNLMPPEIAEAERFRRLQLLMGGAVVLSAVVVGGLYHHAKGGISTAQDQLTTAQTQQGALNTQLSALSDVSTTYASVQAKQALLQQAMGTEIRWSYILNDLSFRIPSNVWLTGMQATEGGVASTTPTTGALVPAAGTTTTVGNITFNVVGFKHDDVATWLDSLAKEKGFTDPVFTNSTEGAIGDRGVVNAATSVGVTSKAYSNRFVPKAGS